MLGCAFVIIVGCTSQDASIGTTSTVVVPSAPIVAISTSSPPATTSPTAGSSTTTGSTALPATTSTAPMTLRQCVESWPLDERAALLVWPSVYSADWNSAIAAVNDLGLGGVILMKPSDSFAAELGMHITELDVASMHGLLVATDEEGGKVQRLSALGAVPSQEAMSTLTPDARLGVLLPHARALSDAGVDVILGPVVDVRPTQGSDPLGQGRLFVGDGNTVATLALEYTRAWQSAGMLPVLKHFPGHGSASTDTHLGLATTPGLDQLLQSDLVPYRQLADAGVGVMVGHLSVPGLTDGTPASLTPATYAYLRNDMGYADAIVMTDALGMGGVGLPITEASVRAIAAGADVAIFTETGAADDVIGALVGAVQQGRLPVERIDDAAERVARELAARGRACVPGA